ncbi:inverse autotransporter beta domain-containing protein [Aeromonas veronii]
MEKVKRAFNNKVSRVATIVFLSLYSSVAVISPVAQAKHNLKNKFTLVPYSVSDGETLAEISRRHGISESLLQELNKEYLTSVNGGVTLIKGQLIYVPAKTVNALPDIGSADISTESSKDIESIFANEASRIGSTYGKSDSKGSEPLGLHSDTRFATSSNSSDDVKVSIKKNETKYLKQKAISGFEAEANERVNSLLGSMGTAKVKFGLAEDLQLNEYEADLFVPLAEARDDMVFMQAGARYFSNSKRNVFNLGLGKRYFLEDWMIGYNSFLDYDATRSHLRVGLGGEAWADFMKLSVNAYSPLSSWKHSNDFDDYLERAARGFDLHAKYYLPQYPQLALSAKVEQYFGDEVDLLGSKKVERNPYGGTLGLEWQPVPLANLGVEHQQAKGGQNDTRLNLALEWKLGSSLDEMLNSNKVAGSRTLQGMRHDLVERNNNIVLEYKQKERAITIEHAPVRGMSGQKVLLSPSVTLSSGKIVSWHWRSADPLLQGALSDSNIQSPALTLPALPLDALLDKEFTLNLTVTDDRGNSYDSAPIPVVVEVNPELLLSRLVVVAKGQPIADSHESPELDVDMDEEGRVIEFVMVRQFKDGSGGYLLEKDPIQDVLYSQLQGFTVEQLPGEMRSYTPARPRADVQSAESEPVWVNRLKVTPKNQLPSLANEVLTIKAKGNSGQSDAVLLNLSATHVKAAPQISDLHLTGKLEVGNSLSATYHFNPNGGDATDHSTYAWGIKGETSDRVANGQAVIQSGFVPAFTLGTAQVGTVIELSLQARNGLAVTGNTLTVDSSMTTQEGNESEGGPVVIDPYDYRVQLRYVSTATVEENGIAGQRPVANNDAITAYCEAPGSSAATPCDMARYNLRWLARDANGNVATIAGATDNIYVPQAVDQGKQILVEAALK